MKLIERIWDDPWTFPDGQRQRLAFTIILAMRPQFLVLGEPTNTIDTTDREELYDLISSLAVSGMVVIVIDHDLGSVLSIVNQALAFDADGRTIAVGPLWEVFMSHRRGPTDVGVRVP